MICMHNIGSFIFCLEIKKMLDNSYGATFLIFFSLIENFKMDELFETYGSDGFRDKILHDERGKLIKTDKLFYKIYDFWVMQHASGFMKTFEWYNPKEVKLEKILRRKCEKMKDLPLINVVLKKIKEGGQYFNPKSYVEDEEKNFENLQQWKNNFENHYLEKYSWLKRPPIRHKKVYRHVKILHIR